MIPQPVIHLFGQLAARAETLRGGVNERAGSGQIPRTSAKSPPAVDSDPCLLLLLADQELVAGREEQARYLVEAAYEFFDLKAKANIRTLHVSSSNPHYDQ